MNCMYIILILLIILITFKLIVKNNYEYFVADYNIKDIKPKYTNNADAKISFVYFYTSNIYDYCKYSLINITHYCNKHNYGLIVYDQPFNDDVSMCWNKIAAIILNLKKYEYLIWIDADALINNMNITIESIINLDRNKDLYICEDIYVEYECTNSGVMIIKNTEWSNNLFKKIWYSPIPHLHNDQNVIFYEIVKDINPNSNPSLKNSEFCIRTIHPKVAILPENTFNSHIYNYKENDFILHLMGYNTKTRISVMKQINHKLGLDNYSINDCINLIDSNESDDRINKIKNKCVISD